MIKGKAYKILAYTIQTPMPKRDGVDSFLMAAYVKTWFCANNNQILKHSYQTTTEKLTQIILL